MADFNVSLEKSKFFLQSQYHDEEKWALNMCDRYRHRVIVAGCEWPGNQLYCVIDWPLASCSYCTRFIPHWRKNLKLLRAAGLFAGSILLMRSYGDLMAI